MISFDSTIMSNLSVGLPIDLVVMNRKENKTTQIRVAKDNEFLLKIRKAWGQLIKENFDKDNMKRPPRMNAKRGFTV